MSVLLSADITCVTSSSRKSETRPESAARLSLLWFLGSFNGEKTTSFSLFRRLTHGRHLKVCWSFWSVSESSPGTRCCTSDMLLSEALDWMGCVHIPSSRSHEPPPVGGLPQSSLPPFTGLHLLLLLKVGIMNLHSQNGSRGQGLFFFIFLHKRETGSPE